MVFVNSFRFFKVLSDPMGPPPSVPRFEIQNETLFPLRSFSFFRCFHHSIYSVFSIVKCLLFDLEAYRLTSYEPANTMDAVSRCESIPEVLDASLTLSRHRGWGSRCWGLFLHDVRIAVGFSEPWRLLWMFAKVLILYPEETSGSD